MVDIVESTSDCSQDCLTRPRCKMRKRASASPLQSGLRFPALEIPYSLRETKNSQKSFKLAKTSSVLEQAGSQNMQGPAGKLSQSTLQLDQSTAETVGWQPRQRHIDFLRRSAQHTITPAPTRPPEKDMEKRAEHIRVEWARLIILPVPGAAVPCTY